MSLKMKLVNNEPLKMSVNSAVDTATLIDYIDTVILGGVS